ncbi:unnamed protein product, partial [Ectocarpus sp. 12 AP-2014]
GASAVAAHAGPPVKPAMSPSALASGQVQTEKNAKRLEAMKKELLVSGKVMEKELRVSGFLSRSKRGCWLSCHWRGRASFWWVP